MSSVVAVRRGYPALTGLRALAAGWVVAFHLLPVILVVAPGLGFLAPLASVGWLGVDLFFVLSGFVLMHAHGAEFSAGATAKTWLRFLWLRLARVYPAHLAVTFVLVGAVVASKGLGLSLAHGGGLNDLLQHLFLVQGWGFANELTWNGPSWSVSSEWAAYIVFPVVAMLVYKFRDALRALVVLTAAALAVPMIAYGVLGFDQSVLTISAPLWRIGGEFVAGAAMYRCLSLANVPDVAKRWLGPAMLGAAIATAVSLEVTERPVFLAVPLFACVIPALATSSGAVSSLLSSSVFQSGGRASYSIYLVHAPIVLAAEMAIDRVDGNAVLGTLVLCVALVAVVFCGYVLHHWVEEPARRALRRAVS